MNPTDHMPPVPKVLDYPVALTVVGAVVATAVLLTIARYFDPTGGPLSISFFVAIAFVSVAIFCLFFTIPTDEITSSVIGGLTASFGAVVAYWLGRPRDPPP